MTEEKYYLTKRQKQIEAHRFIKKTIMNEFIPNVLNELKTTVNDLKKDSEWLEEGNNDLKNYIIKKFSLNCDK